MRSYIVFAALMLASFIATAQKPFVTGETVELPSKELGEQRTINIYLPQGYSETDTTHYRVIYLLDGSANEDFPHIAGLVQFYNMMELMPKTIVVGIANVNRKRDFTFPVTTKAKNPQANGKEDKWTAFFEKAMKEPTAGGADKFLAFVEKELQPYITTHYRTGQRTLIGQSLGGLMATYVLAYKPQLFDDYFVISPSLWWDHESLLAKVDPAKLAGKTVYLAVGKEGDVMEHDAAKLAGKLQLNKNAKVIFTPFARETHATILHNAVYEAFRALYSINYMGE